MGEGELFAQVAGELVALLAEAAVRQGGVVETVVMLGFVSTCTCVGSREAGGGGG